MDFMNKKVLHTLEYFKIIDRLVEEADSTLGKDRCRHLLPSSDKSEIISWQAETSHALMRRLKWGKLSFHGLQDIRPSLRPLEKGGILGMGELLSIARCLEIAKSAIEYHDKDPELSDALSGRFLSLTDVPDLRREINRCILSPEEMAAIKKKFENSGMSNLSEFVRAMIFEGYIVQINEKELKEIHRIAKNVAKNINQIAHSANITNKVYKEDIEEIKELGDKLWRPLLFLQTKVAHLKH